MRILALDLATKTGWAFCDGTNLTSGVENFKGGRYEGGGMRFLRFSQWLASTVQLTGPEVVVYEEIRRHMGADAAHIYGGLLSQLTAYCEQHGIPYKGIPVGTIKKTATGKGNAPKDAMVAAAGKAWPDQQIQDDNQADALWILETGKREVVHA